MADILQKIKTCREFLCGECEYDALRRAKGETVCMQKLLDDAADALERKKGKNLDVEWPSLFECSVCGCYCVDTLPWSISTINFCPNCGADCQEEET